MLSSRRSSDPSRSEVEVAVGKAKIQFDCYIQTGQGILPIHYLVDTAGRLQLITQENTNWALAKLG